MSRRPINDLVHESIVRVLDGRPANDLREASNLLVAEGDSWFDFMAYDVVDKLEFLGYDVESVADAGDTLCDMANNIEQRDRLTTRLLKLKRQRLLPRAILVSAGGNDLVKRLQCQTDDESDTAYKAPLLNPPGSEHGIVNMDRVVGFVDGELRPDYLLLLRFVTALCMQVFDTDPIPIITHGYANPVPDGRYAGFAIFRRGPWLKPVFDGVGHTSLVENTSAMGQMMGVFNHMLQRLTTESDLKHVRYVDVREHLDNTVEDERYQRDWHDEMHPNYRSFPEDRWGTTSRDR